MFAQLTVLVLAGLSGPLLAFVRRGLVPVVVGELAAGIALGHTGTGVIDPHAQPLPAFRAIGFAMLMLNAGTHVDIGSSAIRRGFLRGLLAFSAVAAIAIPLGLLIDRGLAVGHPALLVVLVTGSSAAFAFPIISERGLTGTAISLLIAWVSIADATTVIVMPLTLAGATNIAVAFAGDLAIVAAGALTLVIMSRARRAAVSRDLRGMSLRRGWALQLRLSVLLLLALSAIAERTGAGTLVAGFVAGMVIVRLREPGRLAVQLSGVADGFFVPLFFVLLGAEIDLRALAASPSDITLALALAAAAVLTHLVAARIAVPQRFVACGLAASAQLGLPAAAASLGLGARLLTPSQAAAVVAAGCLTLVPATVGSALLARAAPATRPAELGERA